MRIALATSAEHPSLHEDDRLLIAPLEARGAQVTAAVWDDPAVAWDAFDACVIRSTWDYTGRRDEFVAWAERAGQRTRLYNPAEVVRWNSHKAYLVELAAAGVPVVPTAIVRAGEPFDLAAIGEARGWDEVVVKPCVSAGARDTVRVRAEDGQAEAEATRARGDLMVQPYQPTVESSGERSLIFFAGRFSHAIRKHPMLAPTRPTEGGEPRVDVAADERAMAEDLLALAASLMRGTLLYARVDLVRDGAGRPQLMELEVIEPRLFFFAHPPAADRCAEAIVRAVHA